MQESCVLQPHCTDKGPRRTCLRSQWQRETTDSDRLPCRGRFSHYGNYCWQGQFHIHLPASRLAYCPIQIPSSKDCHTPGKSFLMLHLVSHAVESFRLFGPSGGCLCSMISLEVGSALLSLAPELLPCWRLLPPPFTPLPGFSEDNFRLELDTDIYRRFNFAQTACCLPPHRAWKIGNGV